MADENKMLEAALKYAGMGLAVFPLGYKKKTPATTDGFKSATTDKEQIKNWWGKSPGDKNNIGIATGAISGNLVVIDIDKDEQKGKDGFKFFTEWLDEYGALPKTATAATGRGGMHLLFRSEQPEKSRAGIYPSIDIRAEGGYIVAPPSVHPNGETYKWSSDPVISGIAKADNLVTAFLHPLEDIEKKAFQIEGEIIEGERNHTLFKAACSMRDKGFNEQAIYSAIMAENQSKCVPPLDDREVQTLVKSALKYEPEHRYNVTTKNGVIKPVKKSAGEPKQLFKWASDVKAEPVKWLWYPYFVDENINIFGGETGTGKTWNLCAIVAAITTDCQPKGMPGIVEKQGNVLYLGGEDGNSGIRARLEAVGADLSKVALVEKSLDCTGNDFTELTKEVKPALVIIDPLMSFVGSDVNINDYIGARQVSDHLREVAREYKTSIIMVVHPPKKGDYKLLYRFTGSGAFVDATRTATYIGYHPTDPNRRVGIQPKNNIKRTVPYTFTLDEEMGFMWTGEDPTVRRKDVEAASAWEAESSGSNLEYYEKVIVEVMKKNPTGLNATAKEILDEFSRIRGHDIKPQSFGQVLNKKMFQQALSRKGITLTRGSRTHGNQKYSVYYTDQLITP